MLRDLILWVRHMVFLPQPRKVYTLSTLPSPDDYDGETIPVSDGANGPTLTSVNGAWTYPDGTTV